MPKTTEIMPKITYGITFLVALFVNVITSPLFLDRCVFRASVKFFELARLIGMIELRSGIKMPIARAQIEAYQPGKIDGMNPRSYENRLLQTNQMHGTDITKPRITEGNTNMVAWVSMSPTKPPFVSPTRRITPISKVFVSTEIRRSEQIRRHATTMKMIRRMSKMRPMNRMAQEYSYISKRSEMSVPTLNMPSF